MGSISNGPAFVFSPGVFHLPALFQPLVNLLENDSIPATTVEYPTIGPKAEQYSFKDDVDAVRDTVERTMSSLDSDVILVSHSYGGWPASRALNGLDKTSREQDGKRNGIVALVFLAAFIVPDGYSMYEALGKVGVGPPKWAQSLGPTMRAPSPMAAELFFSDLSPPEQRYWASKLKPQNRDDDPPRWNNSCWHLPIPKFYVILENDITFPPRNQKAMSNLVRDATWTTVTLDSDHEPMVSHTEETASLLTRIWHQVQRTSFSYSRPKSAPF